MWEKYEELINQFCAPFKPCLQQDRPPCLYPRPHFLLCARKKYRDKYNAALVAVNSTWESVNQTESWLRPKCHNLAVVKYQKEGPPNSDFYNPKPLDSRDKENVTHCFEDFQHRMERSADLILDLNTKVSKPRKDQYRTHLTNLLTRMSDLKSKLAPREDSETGGQRVANTPVHRSKIPRPGVTRSYSDPSNHNVTISRIGKS